MGCRRQWRRGAAPVSRTRMTIAFADTQPLQRISSPLPPEVPRRDSERNGARSGCFTARTTPPRSRGNRDAIFDCTRRALAWLDEYTGIPYPFGKFDFVLIPSFQFGGMEHAGAIFYNAASLMLDETATQISCSGERTSSRMRRRTCGSAIS